MWNLTRASARFCIRDREILIIHTNWGTRGWRPASQKEIWGYGLMACWIRVNSVPWQPETCTVVYHKVQSYVRLNSTVTEQISQQKPSSRRKSFIMLLYLIHSQHHFSKMELWHSISSSQFMLRYLTCVFVDTQHHSKQEGMWTEKPSMHWRWWYFLLVSVSLWGGMEMTCDRVLLEAPKTIRKAKGFTHYFFGLGVWWALFLKFSYAILILLKLFKPLLLHNKRQKLKHYRTAQFM